jgi:hypothetical protein
MQPNILAKCRSKKKKTRQMFDLSVCPEDLILLSRADASGKLDAPYDDALEAFLRERLEDYRLVMTLPMADREDLLAAGFAPGEALEAALARARQLHFSGFDRLSAVRQVTAEAACGRDREGRKMTNGLSADNTEQEWRYKTYDKEAVWADVGGSDRIRADGVAVSAH